MGIAILIGRALLCYGQREKNVTDVAKLTTRVGVPALAAGLHGEDRLKLGLQLLNRPARDQFHHVPIGIMLATTKEREEAVLVRDDQPQPRQIVGESGQ